MLTRIILISLFISSCGKEVNLSNSKLESVSQINQAEITKTQSDGVLMRKSSSTEKDRLQYEGNTYDVSIYSSYNALEFIASKAMGTTQPVKFKGKILNKEIQIEEIQ